ncbi:MAG TPA: hypothetical protein VF282_05375 [Bacillota bacterium]
MAPLTGLTLAVLLLVATVIEQVRHSLGPFGRSLWMMAAPPLVYGLAAWALTGRLAVALVLAALTLGARVLLHFAIDPLPPTLWKGLAQTTCVHASIFLGWMVFQPLPAPWFLGAGSFVAGVFTGGPVPVDAMARALVTVAAYVFVWGSGTLITRAALGIDDSFTRREAGVSLAAQREAAALTAAHRQTAAALDQEPIYRWGRLIGNLERFIILTLTLHGQLAAVGFVLAAKSVARFEMAREHAEYFLVGTLTSTGLALTVGLTVHGLLG